MILSYKLEVAIRLVNVSWVQAAREAGFEARTVHGNCDTVPQCPPTGCSVLGVIGVLEQDNARSITCCLGWSLEEWLLGYL